MTTALDTAVSRMLPEMQRAEHALRAAAAAAGITYTVADFGGLRTEADTTRILDYRATDYAAYVRDLKKRKPDATPLTIDKWRPIAPFGSSYHNFGAALDLRIVSRPTTLSTDAKALAKLGALAAACGLRWGGNFATKVDPPHFELAIPLSEARRLWAASNPPGAVTRASPAGAVSATLLVLVVVAGLALALAIKRT